MSDCCFQSLASDSTSSNIIYTTRAVFALSMSNKTIFTFVNITTTLFFNNAWRTYYKSTGWYVPLTVRVTENSDQVRARQFSFTSRQKNLNDFCLHFGRGHGDQEDYSQKVTQLFTYGYVTSVKPKARSCPLCKANVAASYYPGNK
jgi:hypothetical protein